MNFDIGSGFQAAIAAFVLSSGNPYAAAAAFVAGGLAGGDAKRHAANLARTAYNEAQVDRAIMVQSATAPHKIVYGRAMVSGPIAFAHSSGDKGQFLHLVIPLAGHECDAVEAIYLNETALTLDANGWATNEEFAVTDKKVTTQTQTVATSGAITITLPSTVLRVTGVSFRNGSLRDYPVKLVNTYNLTGNTLTFTNTTGYPQCLVTYEYLVSSTQLVRVRTYLGTSTQAADADLVAESGGKWTADHRLRGLCYVCLRLEYNQDIMGATGVPNVAAVVRGRKVWDPNNQVTAWSDNAALCVADYLRTYMGASAAEVPDAELGAEADVCWASVTVAATGATEHRYTCNGVLSTAATPQENLDALCECMAGHVVWAQGRYRIQAGAHRASTLSLNEDMLADGTITIQPSLQRTELFNRVTARYTEPAKAYTTVEAPSVANATYLAADGGLDLPLDVTLDLVDGQLRAQRLAKLMLDRARQGLTVQLECSLRAYDVTPGDTVDVSLARYGWIGKPFMVVRREHDLVAQRVRLTLRETVPEVWDWAYGQATTVDLTPNTTLPSAWAKIAPLHDLAATSGTPHLARLADGSVQCRAKVTWTGSSDIHVLQGGAIRLLWGRADIGEWDETLTLPGDATAALIGPLEEGRLYVIGVVPVTQLGRQSPTLTLINHLAVGESEPASDVTGLAAGAAGGGQVPLSWDHCPDADYRETVISVGAAFVDAVPVFTGAADAAAWVPAAAGTHTLWAIHRDRSGNPSAVPASITVTVTDADIGSADVYDVKVESTNGDEFRVGQNRQTLLIAHVFRNGVEVTAETPDSWFSWRRVSVLPEDLAQDAAWNTAYASGYKQINVSVDDVASQATFHCDLFRP